MINFALQAVGVLVTALAWVPQTFRSLASDDPSGISLTSWGVGAGTGAMFAFYGLRTNVWSLTLSEGAFCIGALVLVGTLVTRRVLCAIVLSTLVASWLVVVFAPVLLISLLGIAGTLAMRLAQLRTTIVTKSLAGLSRWSWVLLSVNLVAWGLYGWRTQHWTLVVTSGLALVFSLLLLFLTYHFSKKRRAPQSPASAAKHGECLA